MKEMGVFIDRRSNKNSIFFWASKRMKCRNEESAFYVCEEKE